MSKLINSIYYLSCFNAKRILYCKQTTKYCGSFTHQIFKYFDAAIAQNTLQYQNVSKPNNRLSETNNTFNVDTKLKSILSDISNLSVTTEKATQRARFEKICTALYSIINCLDHSELLNLLHTLMKVDLHMLVTHYIYDLCVSRIIQDAKNQYLNKHEMIHLLFFISLIKDKNKSYIYELQAYLPNVEDLTLMEKCITARSFYISSTKLSHHQMLLYENILAEDFKDLIVDPRLLISVCRVMRSSAPKNKISLKNFSNIILNLNVTLGFNTIVEVLNLYSQTLLYEPEVINKLMEDCQNMIEQDLSATHFTLDLKNVTKYLWSLCNLGIILNLQEKLLIKTYIEKRFNEYCTMDYCSYLVTSLLSLNMLRCYHRKLIMRCLNEGHFLPIIDYSKKYGSVTQWQLALLLNQMSLEMKISIPEELRTKVFLAYKPSTRIRSILEVGTKLREQGIVENVAINCPIKTIRIPGVTLYGTKKIYHVDILDNQTCLKDTTKPCGLLSLKSRLLYRLRQHQILINGNVFEGDPAVTALKIEDQIVTFIKYEKAANAMKGVSADELKKYEMLRKAN